MASTLAHGVTPRRRAGWRAPARAVAGAAVVVLLVARGGDGDPLLPERTALGPAEPGTYRMVGTERDGRSGRTAATAETFTVDPWYEVGGVEHQVVRSAGGVSWRWEPPLRTLAAPLAAGRAWTARTTATVPDAAGYRRVRAVEVAGRRVRAFVLDSWVRTSVTSTWRADRSVTTTTYTTEGRSWFSPAHMLVVRREQTTTVVGDPAAPAPYEVAQRVELERLSPS